MLGTAASLPEACPDCGGRVITSCPDCGEAIASMMAITCSGCGRALRDRELFGVEIRRKPERHAARTTACGTPLDDDHPLGTNVTPSLGTNVSPS
jgi:predicted amidophosphoribosyltransferase